MRKSYVCSDLPTEVVMLKVVFPRGSTENDTSVGDTRPIVLKGANIFGFRLEAGVATTPFTLSRPGPESSLRRLLA